MGKKKLTDGNWYFFLKKIISHPEKKLWKFWDLIWKEEVETRLKPGSFCNIYGTERFLIKFSQDDFSDFSNNRTIKKNMMPMLWVYVETMHGRGSRETSKSVEFLSIAYVPWNLEVVWYRGFLRFQKFWGILRDFWLVLCHIMPHYAILCHCMPPYAII